MPPKKTAATRKSARRGRPNIRVSDAIPTATPTATPDFGQLFAEHMAATMPDMVAQIRDSILQSLAGNPPGGGSGPSETTGGGAGGSGTADQPVVLSDVRGGCSLKTFLGCKPLEFKGTEGAIGTLQWMEKMESIFVAVGCVEEDKVKFATFVFQGTALTWWNSVIGVRGRDAISSMSWVQFRELMTVEFVPEAEIQRLEQEFWSLTMQGSDIQGYITRFYSLSQLVPHLVQPELKRIGRFIHGLPQEIRGGVISARPGTFQSAVDVAIQLTHNMVRDGMVPKSEDDQNSEEEHGGGFHYQDSRKKSRRSDGPQGVQSYAAVVPSARHPKCDRCGNFHSKGAACWVCGKCNELGHTDRYCKASRGDCFECGMPGHFRSRCPKLISSGSGTSSGSGSGARGRAFVLGAQETQHGS